MQLNAQLNFRQNATRRNFLAHTAAAATTGALAVGFNFHAAAKGATAAQLSPPKAVAKDLIESFVAIHRGGTFTVHVGKVDLGTGTRTALSQMAQMAADELDMPFDKITMVMGDTATTPDQWITGANLTISQGGAEEGSRLQGGRQVDCTRRHSAKANL